MTTSQLAVLWYAGLLISGILLLDDFSADRLIIVVLLLASLTIFTLRPHPQARKQLVLASVLGPPVAIGLLLYSWIEFNKSSKGNAETRLIELDKVVISDFGLAQVSDSQRGDFLDSTYISGTVQNLSYFFLTEITVEIDLRAVGLSPVLEKVPVVAPPGQYARFRQKLLYDVPEMHSQAAVLDSVPLRVVGTRGHP